ncbi:MAG TPA: tRNA (N6-isopentenyl adenosine(37)-C2)-methylthiotransferase MiaB [Acidobacteriota bacterium]|nr:tRNA (N6-isopentenyl adenosine(37)-C2)-methylthiotransferase MiaB [Acidobacteriota bacterium]
MKAKTFFIETHGCQMNEHDSEKIAGLLVHRGMTPVHSLDEADLYLLNTCSVREKAAQRVYSRLGEVRRRKREKADFLIGVVGCVAQQESREMIRRAPYVDLVVGTHLYHSIPDLLDGIESNPAGSQRVATQFLKDSAPVEVGAALRGSGIRAHVTIMEGCNKRCAFCVVPFTRGAERNRPRSAIFEDVRRAIDQGYVEVLLLGQTVNSYRDPGKAGYRFAHLLADVAREKALRRIRFTSPHPRHFDDELIESIASRENICNQVHLPLQSGSNRILRKMRRQHDREWFLELVEKFRSCGRPIALSTDMIVGFPGESEDDFQQTLKVVRMVRFESMFSFKYSVRPNTEAAAWRDDVPEPEKTSRLMILQRLQREIQLQIHRESYLGKTFEILTEGTSRDGVLRFGRTTTNKVVNFPGNPQPGTFVDILIEEAGPNSFRGRPRSNVSKPEPSTEALSGALEKGVLNGTGI